MKRLGEEEGEGPPFFFFFFLGIEGKGRYQGRRKGKVALFFLFLFLFFFFFFFFFFFLGIEVEGKILSEEGDEGKRDDSLIFIAGGFRYFNREFARERERGWMSTMDGRDR